LKEYDLALKKLSHAKSQSSVAALRETDVAKETNAMSNGIY
jgi:hypothetical protein